MITGSEEDAGVGVEGGGIMPGVEHAGWGPSTNILTLTFLQDSRYVFKKIVI